MGPAMVKVGFIVEGDSEKVLIESAGFRKWAGGQVVRGSKFVAP